MRINEKNIPELNMNEIGARIKSLREDMKQAEFANLFNLEQQDISKIETGKIKPSTELLFKISVHFKKSMEWMLTGNDEVYESQASGVFEHNPTYPSKINIIDLKHKTDVVLRSNTPYSMALKDIILAYYEATICQEELEEKKKALGNRPAVNGS